MSYGEAAQEPIHNYSSDPTIPAATEDSFYFRDEPVLTHDRVRASHDVSISLAAQAIALRYALDYVLSDTSQSELFGEVKALVQATVAVPMPTSKVDIRQLPDDPRCSRVVFKSGREPVVFVGPSLEAPTGGVLDMGVSEVQALQDSFAVVEAIPSDKLSGSGTEVLDVISPQYRDMAIAALRSLVTYKPGENGLLTHSSPALDPTLQFFADEARSMLGLHGEPAAERPERRASRMGAALRHLRCSITRRLPHPSQAAQVVQ